MVPTNDENAVFKMITIPNFGRRYVWVTDLTLKLSVVSENTGPGRSEKLREACRRMPALMVPIFDKKKQRTLRAKRATTVSV